MQRSQVDQGRVWGGEVDRKQMRLGGHNSSLTSGVTTWGAWTGLGRKRVISWLPNGMFTPFFIVHYEIIASEYLAGFIINKGKGTL